MEGRYLKLLLRTLSGLFIVLTAGSGAGAAWFLARYPRVASPPTVLIHVTAALLERGRYLATHVAVCMDCHSTRDWDAFSGPIVPGTEGAGGGTARQRARVPGHILRGQHHAGGRRPMERWRDPQGDHRRHHAQWKSDVSRHAISTLPRALGSRRRGYRRIHQDAHTGRQ